MLKFLIAAIVFQVTVSQQVFQDDLLLDGQLTIVVEDNLGSSNSAIGDSSSEEWSERSVVTVRSVKLGQTQISHSRPWNDDLTHKLKKLAHSNGFYKLRLYLKNGKEPHYVYTFTDACLVYSGGLSEVISMLVDVSPSLGGFTQSLIGASIVIPSALYCGDGGEDQPPMLGHNTTVIIRSPVTPFPPDTATFIQKMESINKEKLENKDNRSFFAKYWMYIIPFVLLLATSYGGQDGGR